MSDFMYGPGFYSGGSEPRQNRRYSEGEYKTLPEDAQALRLLCLDWFQAMEDGSVSERHPDPAYPHPIPDDTPDKLVESLDEACDKERGWALQEDAGYDVGPEFSRLAPEQRLAFAQQVDALLRRYGS